MLTPDLLLMQRSMARLGGKHLRFSYMMALY
jgi:hypothetical protein